MVLPGTLAPGSDANAGTIGDFEVVGELDLSNSQVQIDLSAASGTTDSDQITVSETATLTGGTLSFSFSGNEFEIGQQFLILATGNSLGTSFAIQGDAFAIPDRPFLELVEETLLVHQLSGSIYPSLIGAEINHIQNNLESVRDRVVLQRYHAVAPPAIMPWVRAYGVSARAETDHCNTNGYYQDFFGVELGFALSNQQGLSSHVSAHHGGGDVDSWD